MSMITRRDVLKGSASVLALAVAAPVAEYVSIGYTITREPITPLTMAGEKIYQGDVCCIVRGLVQRIPSFPDSVEATGPWFVSAENAEPGAPVYLYDPSDPPTFKVN